MAPTGCFFDLSLLPDHSSNSNTSSRLLAATRALDLGYSAVALDHPHRGLLPDSHSGITSSLPLPPSTSLHLRRRRHPFQQYTRLTLSLDSAAACASALAPSAARLLRTYDIVAARPLTQAAFDHLCQAASDHLDIVSIDFSHKLPFRLKLPMLKLALQRGLHFEIAYAPLIADASSRRQVVAEAKLLVDWTKGKNLIISSAARNASEIRGPYDVTNLCAYLLGLSNQQAKAAISVNCRSLISKALRKKSFYKETIRIDRLLPNEQLNSANFKLGDWIGWDLMPHNADQLSLVVDLEPSSNKGELSGYKRDLQSLDITTKPSSNKDELPCSPMNGLIEVSHHVPCDGDESLIVGQPEESSHDKEIPFPVETREGPVQFHGGESLINCGFCKLQEFGHHNVATSSDTPGNDEIDIAHCDQAASVPSFKQKGIGNHIEFFKEAMELDGTESCKRNLSADASVPLSSDDNLACSALPCTMELSDTSTMNKYPHQSSDILDYAKACAEHDSGFTSCQRVNRAPQDHDIPFGSSILTEDKGLDCYNGISVDSGTPRDTTEPLGLPPCERDDEAPSDLAVQLDSDLCRDIMMPQQVMRDKVAPVDRRTTVSMEHTLYDPETTSTAFLCEEGSSDTTCKIYDSTKQNSNETKSSLDKDVAKIHRQPLNYSYASEKQTKKLRSHSPAYLPFLGFLKSVPFKKKASKTRRRLYSANRATGGNK